MLLQGLFGNRLHLTRSSSQALFAFRVSWKVRKKCLVVNTFAQDHVGAGKRCVCVWYMSLSISLSAIHFLAGLSFPGLSSFLCLPPIHLSVLLSPMRVSFTLCPLQLHRPNWVPFIISICSPSGSHAVGSTAWEAAANLSLEVYLLYVTTHELRHRDIGRCVLWWVAVDGRNMELPLIKHVQWKTLMDAFQ